MKLRKKAAPARSKARAGEATFDLDVKREGLEPILGAAYLLMDRAYASFDGDRAKKLSLTLRPKENASVADLRAAFLVELATQKTRWAIARNNLPVREYVAEQAVLLANGRLPSAPPAAAEPAGEQLSDEQRREIEKLIAEVEDEIKTMKQKKAVPDPKNIKASWEEKQEVKTQEKP